MKKIKKTILIVAEGFRDSIFCKYLKALYERSHTINIIIRNGNGGTAVGLVEQTVFEAGDYTLRVTFLDNDKSEQEMESARTLASNHNIQLLENTPCIEALFIMILTNQKVRSSLRSKKIFNRECLNELEFEIRNLYTLFPKSVLNAKRHEIEILDILINLMEDPNIN